MSFWDWLKNLVDDETLERRYIVKHPRGGSRKKRWALSKHNMGKFRATKRYADGRQKAPHNRRPMRKRK